MVPFFHEYQLVIFYDPAKLFSFKLCDETSMRTEFVLLQNTNLYSFHAHTHHNAFNAPLTHQ